ncbi:MAG: hypothetical protein ACHQEM_08030 [Chitinophagales bacterium]
MTSGYSNTPLLKKLGIRDDTKLLLIHAPINYFDLLSADISGQLAKEFDIPDIVHLFAKNKKEMQKSLRQLKKTCMQNPKLVIWVSWYKKSAGIPTDLTENDVREYALKNGLVDVKVCAVSEIWSGLKLVVPLKKR